MEVVNRCGEVQIHNFNIIIISTTRNTIYNHITNKEDRHHLHRQALHQQRDENDLENHQIVVQLNEHLKSKVVLKVQQILIYLRWHKCHLGPLVQI